MVGEEICGTVPELFGTGAEEDHGSLSGYRLQIKDQSGIGCSGGGSVVNIIESVAGM